MERKKSADHDELYYYDDSSKAIPNSEAKEYRSSSHNGSRHGSKTVSRAVTPPSPPLLASIINSHSSVHTPLHCEEKSPARVSLTQQSSGRTSLTQQPSIRNSRSELADTLPTSSTITTPRIDKDGVLIPNSARSKIFESKYADNNDYKDVSISLSEMKLLEDDEEKKEADKEFEALKHKPNVGSVAVSVDPLAQKIASGRY